MICQNCRAEVDNDLIFCTNCGERLFEGDGETPTVVLPAATDTRTVGTSPTQPVVTARKSRWWVWLLAIMGLLGLTAAGVAAIFVFVLKPTPPAVVNKPATQTPAKKTPTIKPSPTATPVKTPDENTNADVKKPETDDAVVVKDRINIDVDEHYAVPFEVLNDGTKIIGTIKATTGEGVLGFVYTQEAYDDYFPNEIHKTFSFEGQKSAEIDQTMVKGNYVIIFVNDTDQPLSVTADVSLQKR